MFGVKVVGDTVAKVCASPRNSTQFTRPFLLVRGKGLGTRLQATMHYLLHMCIYSYVYMRECMPVYANSSKVTITFIHRSKIAVQKMYGLVHISDSECIYVEKFRAIPICLW